MSSKLISALSAFSAVNILTINANPSGSGLDYNPPYHILDRGKFMSDPSANEIQSPYSQRQMKLSALIQSAGLEAIVVNPGPSLLYLTGLNFHLMERPVVAIFGSNRIPLLVIPELEIAKVENLPFSTRIFTYGDNPATWPAIFQQAVSAALLDGRRVGIEPRRLRVLEYRLLESPAPQAQFVSAEATLAQLRQQKDPSEISAMRQAVNIAQRALQQTIPQVKLGMRAAELASELTLQLLRAGAQPEFPFTPIVSFGPDTANPHAVPGERRLAPGELLLIDWGAKYQDYVSDLTRTFAIGEVDPELERVAQIVAQANAAGRAAAKPGAPAGSVDHAARQVIEQAGYGQYFTHRTGHGIGMEEHEDPYLFGENEQPLLPGMTFTVEPGIYFQGRAGVRIEDDILITQDGSETLSDLPRELIRIVA
jgi:Xaa-Pro dipeptidase